MKEPLEIGRPDEVELEALVAVDRECFPLHPYGPVVMRQMFELCGGLFLRARHRQIAGFTIGAIGAEGPDVGWILSLAVAPPCRNAGLGKTLTVALLERMREAGILRVRLSVEPDNEQALAIYRGLGASGSDLRERYFGSEPRVLMEFAL